MNKEVFLKEKKNNQFSLNIKDGVNNGKLEFSLAKWETKTLKKKCGKITLFRSSSSLIAEQLIKKFNQIIKKENFFWVQLDSINVYSSSKNINQVFFKNGFQISNKYLSWVLKKKQVNLKLIKLLSDKNLFKIAKKKDIKKLSNFTEKYPDPGRYVTKKNFRKYGIKLYKSWVTNSIKDNNKKVFFYEKNNKILAYQAISYNYKKKIMTLGILRNSKEIPSLGTLILINSIKFFLKQKKLTMLNTRSSEFNIEINKINLSLGMKMKSKGINFQRFYKII